MPSLIVPHYKHLMCGFLFEGCCSHLVRVADGGWEIAGPIYVLKLFCQTFIFVYVCYCVLGFWGFMYGRHLYVHTLWPI